MQFELALTMVTPDSAGRIPKGTGKRDCLSDCGCLFIFFFQKEDKLNQARCIVAVVCNRKGDRKADGAKRRRALATVFDRIQAAPPATGELSLSFAFAFCSVFKLNF